MKDSFTLVLKNTPRIRTFGNGDMRRGLGLGLLLGARWSS